MREASGKILPDDLSRRRAWRTNIVSHPDDASAPPSLISRWRGRAVLEARAPSRANGDTPLGRIIMLFTIALVLLGAWAVSLSGVFPGGDLWHVLLLVGLMLLLIAFMKGREAALRGPQPPSRGE
jgi:hypothetical protein